MTPPVRRMTANGVQFAYFEEGQGPLVLLVHGFPDTAETWRDVRPALAARGYRAVSPFTRGYWPSEVPADGRYDIETLGRDVLAWIEALGERDAIVVGHDWGATAAYAAAALAPERVRFLVTVAIPHPAAIERSLGLLWKMRHFVRFQSRLAERAVRRNDYAYVDTLVRRWSPAWRVPPDETRPVKEAFEHPGCLTAALGYYRAFGVVTPPRLREPTRVRSAAFAGTEDGVMKVDVYERARRFYAESYEVVVMPGGHFMHREHPQRFVDELLRVMLAA